jgi:type IV pilus assembly protein PilZ
MPDTSPDTTSEISAEATPSSERRDSDRAAITLKVDYKRLNTFFADYTKNISRGGTFIPTLNEQIQLNGEVKWVVSEEASGTDNPPGMGIKFKFDTEADRAKVDEFVERLMRNALGSEISQKLLAKRAPADE